MPVKPSAPGPSPSPSTSSRTRSTLNLNQIFTPKVETVKEEKVAAPIPGAVEPELSVAVVQPVWDAFAETRKMQVAEYQLMKRPFTVHEKKITLPLSNPVEEPLLAGMKTQLIAYLRDKLNHSSVTVHGELMEIEGKKIVYTNKEKFDHLAEKYPILQQMKERLGLDTDY
ncbi:MAG: hypothetical protein K1X47_01170 [Cyclobacteriaceae bacterium]|nr:hypothetical protein [Cyclobacteriaceae bacterium]